MNDKVRLKINISEIEAQEIESAYDGILELLKKASGEANIEIINNTLADIIGHILKNLSSNGAILILYTSKIFDKDYIYAHSLNVCIISLKIGLRLKFDKGRLKDLGFLALMHAKTDIKFPEKLSSTVKSDKEMDDIIKLADVYDALTHSPDYRHTSTPYETLTSIIKSDGIFDRRLLKILLEEVTLFPRGNWVKLSTGETGRVTKINDNSPLRPTVEILIDSNGEYLEETKTTDLSKTNLIYISRPLSEDEVRGFEKL